MNTRSPVLQYLLDTYNNCCAVGPNSYSVVNQTMRRALENAIEGRFKFEPIDFVRLCEESYPYGYLGWKKWFPEGGEHFYTLAILSNNRSAAIAFETWKDRPPFIWKKQRLYEGCRFELVPGQHWYCLSFSQDNSTINCGCYQSPDNPMGWRNHAPVGHGPIHRLKLTVGELKDREKRFSKTETFPSLGIRVEHQDSAPPKFFIEKEVEKT